VEKFWGLQNRLTENLGFFALFTPVCANIKLKKQKPRYNRKYVVCLRTGSANSVLESLELFAAAFLSSCLFCFLGEFTF
jgi:hypothetical protein